MTKEMCDCGHPAMDHIDDGPCIHSVCPCALYHPAEQVPSKKLTAAVTALALLGCSFAATWQHSPMLALIFFVASAIAVKVGKL